MSSSDLKTISAELNSIATRLGSTAVAGGGDPFLNYQIAQSNMWCMKYIKYAFGIISIAFAAVGILFIYGLNVRINYDDEDSVYDGRRRTRDVLYFVSFLAIICAVVLMALLIFQ